MRRLLFILLTAATLASAQQRVLVSSHNEVVHLKKGEPALAAVQQYIRQKNLLNTLEACTNPLQFGFDPANYPPMTYFKFNHREMAAVCMVAPADGVVDSLYLLTGSHVNTDSTLFLRIMGSRIYPGSGPGYGSYAPYLPGVVSAISPADSGGLAPQDTIVPICWGYFTNTNDEDGQEFNPEYTPGIGGVAAFAADATPPDSTAWVSTLQRQFPNAPATFPPTDDEIWGLGGYPFRHIRPNSLIKFNLHIIGAPTVHAGQPMMIVFETRGTWACDYYWCDGGDPYETDIAVNDAPLDPSGHFRTHFWKFYEHGGPFAASGLPGWTDRGVGELNVWYPMTVTGNVAPRLTNITNLGTTLDGSPRDITVNIEDCNFSDPLSAGVAWAHMGYSVDGGPYTVVPLNYLGGTTYRGQIPAVAPPTGRPYSRTVRYYVAAADSQGLAMDSGAVHTYKVVSFGNEYYYPDTSVACVPGIIKDTPGSHYLDTTSTLGSSPHPTWFSPPYSDSPKLPKNDGTAGPFPLGGAFIYFGDTVNYAWIGVNGAIALSKTATDTIDVNSNGSYADFDFPSAEHLGRGDTAGRSNIPRNFIGTLWYDLVYVDDANVQYGRIFWKNDSCRFIAEYDSIGELYEPWGAMIPSNTTFRTILNRCDGTIEMQWDNVQEAIALDTISTVAFQGNYGRIIPPDSVATEVGKNPGWLKFYRGSDNGPLSVKPRDGWCVRFHPTVGVAVASGWNLVSVPVIPPGNDYDVSFLFPGATLWAFSYDGRYEPVRTLANGKGYWMRFGTWNVRALQGRLLYEFDDSLNQGWNLIGTIGKSVSTGAVVQDPSGLVTTQYYGYNHGYNIATSLDPGKGYWVKAKGTGVLHLQASSIPKSSPAVTDLSVLSKITVVDAEKSQQALYIGSESDVKVPASMYELPPVAPAGIFDVRFSSQRMVETYPDKPEAGKVYEYPISIQTNAYPVTIQWQIRNTNGRTLTLTDGLGGRIVNNAVLNNSGSIKITNASVKSLVLKLVEGKAAPKEFALRQNYPNPFNPTTNFQFSIANLQFVTLKVYDVLGREVAVLVNEVKQPGEYTVEWNAEGFASGIYFYRLTAGTPAASSGHGFTSIKKMVLLK